MSISREEVLRVLPVKVAVEDKLLGLPGVTGVDIAHKVVAGTPTAIPCILVFVANKGQFYPEHEIPKFIEGIPTDVEEAVFRHSASTPATDQARYDPCQGGSSTAPARFTDRYGTLGMLVTDAASGNKVWLSNYHVFCSNSGWSGPGVDRDVTQPAVGLGGNPATDTIGQVLRGVYGQVVVPWGFDLYVDAAICSSGGRATDPNVIHVGAAQGAANAVENSLVTKYGATTLRTSGQVTSTNFTAPIGGTTFYYQVRVAPPFPGAPLFSDLGDSGSAVFDENFNVIGLVTAIGGGYTIVNPIGQIISALNITVP